MYIMIRVSPADAPSSMKYIYLTRTEMSETRLAEVYGIKNLKKKRNTKFEIICVYIYIYPIYQPLRPGRIWHGVLSGV